MADHPMDQAEIATIPASWWPSTIQGWEVSPSQNIPRCPGSRPGHENTESDVTLGHENTESDVTLVHENTESDVTLGYENTESDVTLGH